MVAQVITPEVCLIFLFVSFRMKENSKISDMLKVLIIITPFFSQLSIEITVVVLIF